MKPTIKDISRITGYSITTVSHILNNKGDRFSDECVTKVRKVVEELEYKPNQLAVSLLKKSTRTIGFIVSDIRNNFFSEMAKAVEEYCNEQSWNMILCNTNDSSTQEIDCINILSEKCVDGIIISINLNSNTIKAQRSIELIKKNNIPYIMVDRTVGNNNLNAVATDH
ncbi:MAG: LacI family DNA-binding transcriptional regulator, partial [Lachnospirales bacterium]